MIAQTDPPYLHGFSARFQRAGYRFRTNGRKCPRGHTGPVRDSDGYCAECRKLEAPSWKITRRTGHAIARALPIPSVCVYVIGSSPDKIRSFLLEECERGKLAPEDYGKTWGIYHTEPIHKFDLATTSGIREANRLENLRVEPLHNLPKK